MIPALSINIPIANLGDSVKDFISKGNRLGLLTARQISTHEDLITIISVILNPSDGTYQILESPLPPDTIFIPSITHKVPQAHWFERSLWDFFGLYPKDHPRGKSLILHESWPEKFHPMRSKIREIDYINPSPRYAFLKVKGEGVFEIPVGPIHAGIIEPGHFRFSCLGEIIQNLEIRLGYQHRGIEHKLTTIPWKNSTVLAEAASTDTVIGNALAHATAIENILGITPSPLALKLRALSLEIERIASHIGDLGGVSSDIGFAAGSTIFSRLRGSALGFAELLTGSRFQTGYIVPGGVSKQFSVETQQKLATEASKLESEFESAIPLLLENSGVLARMDGIGHVRPSLSQDFGLVGPAARASGSAYDVRKSFSQDPYEALDWNVPSLQNGDVLSRVKIRVLEIIESFSILRQLLIKTIKDEPYKVELPDTLPPNSVGIGIVEAWRGELIHMIFTNENSVISRYCIKDPSFNNWTGLAIAARGELLTDFPLCNKSFGLSYSGNDL